MNSEKIIKFEPALSTVLSQGTRWQELAVLVAWADEQGWSNVEDRLELFRDATVSLQENLTILLHELDSYSKAKRASRKPL